MCCYFGIYLSNFRWALFRANDSQQIQIYPSKKPPPFHLKFSDTWVGQSPLRFGRLPTCNPFPRGNLQELVVYSNCTPSKFVDGFLPPPDKKEKKNFFFLPGFGNQKFFLKKVPVTDILSECCGNHKHLFFQTILSKHSPLPRFFLGRGEATLKETCSFRNTP